MILASQSPRRRELMKYITEAFTVKVSDVDETLPEGISPSDAVLRLSKIKALPFRETGETVIGADTVVALGDTILGKPKDAADAVEMLRLLSGKTHSVFTGVTVLQGEKETSFFSETKVTFFTLTDEEIDAYVATGEPLDKAGAYGIQGGACLFVRKIDGDYFNVVGLPVSELHQVLKVF